MEIFKSLDPIMKLDNMYALTIGNFDGVHLGHQKLISDIKDIAHSKNEDLIVCTFVPHPKFILTNAKGFLINSYIERRD